MKKKILMCAFALFAVTTVFAARIIINTSCGVSVAMDYESHHTIGDVINDALILEDYFCG